MVGSDDFRWYAAAPLSAARLVRERLSDEGKSSPLGPGLLDSAASEGQPLPWPGA